MRERLNDAGASSQCKVEGCTNQAIAKYLCNKHRKRLKRNGDPNMLQRRPHGTGTIGRGYLIMSDKRKNIYKHREVMEQFIGRPLLPEECVHHINGDKLDNRIENLQIMSKSEHAFHHCVKGKPPVEMTPEIRAKISISRKGIHNTQAAL